MRDDLLAGWHPTKEVAHLCAQCQWRLTDHVMASCEYGLPKFPAAKSCGQFESEDDHA